MLNIRSGVYVELNFAGSDELPAWAPISPAGPEVIGRDGRRFIIRDPQGLVDALNADNLKRALDLSHSSELKAPRGEDYQVVNWMARWRLNQETGHIEASGEWIEPYAERVRTGELRYISPSYGVDAQNNVLTIRSAGFVPRPNFGSLELNSENLMNEEELKALRTALNLDESATGGDFVAAVDKLKSEHVAALNAEKTPDITKWVPRDKFDEVEAKRVEATTALNAMKTAEVDVQINAAIDKGKTDGKIPPALVDVYKSQFKGTDGLTQLNAILEKAPVIAGSGDESQSKASLPKSEGVSLNADQAAIADMFGNTAEELSSVSVD